MSSIDSVHQIVAAIRAEMTARVNNTAGQQVRTTASRPTNKPGIGTPAQQQQRMGNLISQRVKSLDPDDPKRGRKAFRIFLESVLLAELGDSLINDPAFYQMVDDVQLAMEEDPHIADAIGKAVASLLAV